MVCIILSLTCLVGATWMDDLIKCRLVEEIFFLVATDVTPLPQPGQREGAPHGTETPLTDFLTLVGPFH